MHKPVVILIRDGWGYRPSKKDNAIAQADTKNTDRLMKSYPHILLDASGQAVGLPKGFQGNSEVGHLTIGSGRIPKQALVKIDESIKDGTIKKNPSIMEAIFNCKKRGTAMHLIGLLQTEGVHSKSDHLDALVDMCRKHSVPKLLVHIITDGRDAPPKAGLSKVKALKKSLRKKGIGSIASISGRYYAMDRDKRWARTKKAYEVIVEGKGKELRPMDELYRQGETDEFLLPRKAAWYEGMQKGDSVIFYNFRTDRTRQLTQAIVEKGFTGFKRKKLPVCFVAMTQYYKPMDALVAFEEPKFCNLLGEVIAKQGLRQLRISETEKYAHVTFFFNGEDEVPNKGEDRILIPSPKVATYDLKPEMSAYKITERLNKELSKAKYVVVVVNIVNGDMVGHTGVVQACMKAASVVDGCVGKIADKVLEKGGTALVFADHGNLEDQRHRWRTSHTINPVPFILVSEKKHKLRKRGGLSDIAPTVLDLLGVGKPKEMTGRSLILR